jgi:hypothetical protein
MATPYSRRDRATPHAAGRARSRQARPTAASPRGSRTSLGILIGFGALGTTWRAGDVIASDSAEIDGIVAAAVVTWGVILVLWAIGWAAAREWTRARARRSERRTGARVRPHAPNAEAAPPPPLSGGGPGGYADITWRA